METICDICETKLKHKKDLVKHKNSETCKKIQYLLSKHIEFYKNIINEKTTQNTLLEKQLSDKDNIIKNLQEKSEEYRIIIENSTKNNFKIKKNYDNVPFQIDININNKQLNKTKFKDVPEEQVKNDIQSLKLKDNYQLEYREIDGFINITNLCKAGGKEFKSWNRIDKTKRFLEVLSSAVNIHTADLILVGSGSKYTNDTKNHTWVHPQVAINIAQWISPEFDVLVSKWVYEIMLTGKVDIKENKTTQELDQMNKENKLLKNRVKLLESKVLQKQPRESFENGKNVIYIVTTEYKEAQGHYKIGKAKDLKERMSVYNTTDKHEVIFYTNCRNKKSMDLLEQLIHMKLEDKRIEPNKEWFLSEEDAEDFIKIIEECKKINNL
jgi:hypothetical protein